MKNWKKFMAAVLAVSMTVPSCLPQTLWAAEFPSESTESLSGDFGEENEVIPDDSVTDEITDSDAGAADEIISKDDAEDIEFGSGERDVSENDTGEFSAEEELTEENDDLDLSASPDMAKAEQSGEVYIIQLYNSGKMERSYEVPYEKAAEAKAPAALKKSGYTFKEWNTRSDGKGSAYKPGSSIAGLLEAHNVAVQVQNADAAGKPENAEELEELPESAENAADTNLAEVQNEVQKAGSGPEAGMEEDSAELDLQMEDTEEIDELQLNSAAMGTAENSGNVVALYAIWKKNVSYKITYKLNGGKNNASNPKTYTSEKQVTLKKPTRSGYHFVGWYSDSKFKKKITAIKKGTKGALTLYAKWTPQVKPSSKAATLNSVKGTKVQTITASATVPKYVKSYDEYYYLVYVDSNSGKVKKQAAKVKKPEAAKKKITLKLSISKNPEYAQGKFAIAVKKSKTAWSIISSKSYVSNPEKLASNQKAYFLPKTKKGIQSTNISEVTETKSKTAFINIYTSEVMGGGHSYVYNGKKYYFGELYGLQDFVAQCNAKGIQVTAQISLNKSPNTQSLITGNSPYGRTAFYGWNTSKSSSRQTMEAMFAYLGEKFGNNSCYVSNWILGNEINSASGYYYVGKVSFSKYISMYSEAFRCLYNAVRSSRGSSKVFICLDNCWRQKNVFDIAYTSKSTLDGFAAAVSKLQKGINWNLAYHAYSQPLTEAQFWSSVNAPLLKNDGNTATFITMHNIQALTNYVKNKFGSKTRIILSEQGYSSSFGGQANQAASMAVAYYKAACNPMIDAFIIRSYRDEPVEVAQGLALGLKDAKGKKKTVYNVFKNMDSSSSLKYTGNVLKSKVGNWKAKVPGYSAKRVSSMYRVQ